MLGEFIGDERQIPMRVEPSPAGLGSCLRFRALGEAQHCPGSIRCVSRRSGLSATAGWLVCSGFHGIPTEKGAK
jgi:hypothetical protein